MQLYSYWLEKETDAMGSHFIHYLIMILVFYILISHFPTWIFFPVYKIENNPGGKWLFLLWSQLIMKEKNPSLFQFPNWTEFYFLPKVLVGIALEYSFSSAEYCSDCNSSLNGIGELFQTSCIISTKAWCSVIFTPCLWNMEQHIYEVKEASFFSCKRGVNSPSLFSGDSFQLSHSS